MATARTMALRRGIVRAAVVVGHALLLIAVVNDRLAQTASRPARDERIEVRMLAAPAPLPGADRPLRTRRLTPPPPNTLTRVTPPAPAATDRGATAAPHVDWTREAERVARAAHPPTPPPRTDCEDTDRPGAMRPRCTPRHLSFGWGHEPRTVEFDGGLPFVRLGKRCLIGLGFFGCAIGKLPDANSHLFDERNAADRPSSSVPDVPDARP